MPVSAPNPTMLGAHALAEELARSGVAHACVAPGNRSGPLAFALASQPGMRVWSHVDERSMGFFALGLARATRSPAALACTSGTAAANLLPAVVEAWHARVPLVVLTADRPPDLRDTGANQAIFQAGLYGRHVRWSADLPLPRAEGRALRHLRAQACRAVGAARGPPSGPVHLNVPFAKPLEPTPLPGSVPADLAARDPLAWQGRGAAPFVEVRTGPRPPAGADAALAAGALRGRRGLVVVGPQDDPALPGAALALARAAGFPLLADPLSGLRYGPHARGVLGAYDAVLQSHAAREALAPEVVVRLGAAPTSDALLAWLEERAPAQVVVDDDPDWRDPAHLPGLRVQADPALACAAVAMALRPGSPAGQAGYAARWAAAEQAAREALAGSVAPEAGLWEASAVRAALDGAPPGSTVVVSNSLAVRDLDRVGGPMEKEVRVLGNRGASGIDGLVSTALGAAAARQGPVLLVAGDLAFYHDLPGLLALRRLGLEATLAVVHNDGGRIFEQLPAARHEPPFRDLFVTPHGLDFEHAARMFGARFSRHAEARAFRDAVAEALAKGGAAVVEARVEPAQAAGLRARARDAAVAAVEEALQGAARAG